VRAEPPDAELEEPGALLVCGFAALAVVALDAVGAEAPGANAELVCAESPGALDRVAPPLATARAAAASAALELGRDGEALLAGVDLELDELGDEGGGLTGRVPSARFDVGVERVLADGEEGEDAERAALDPDEFDPDELFPGAPFDAEPDPEPDGVFGFDDEDDVGVDDTGGRV
jgi:hypothetical protein